MGLVTAQAMEAWVRRTEPDTALPPIGKALSLAWSRVALTALLLFLLCSAVPVPLEKVAWADEKERMLPESGIRYPQGFDFNTVGEVSGKVLDVSKPERGPVSFELSSERDTYTVLASPSWYWNDLETGITTGTEIRVRGSKSLGKDGRLYIIAQEIEVLGSRETRVLRDEAGYPLWKGPGRGMGVRGGSGQQGPGMGGMGGGSGGRGHGRR